MRPEEEGACGIHGEAHDVEPRRADGRELEAGAVVPRIVVARVRDGHLVERPRRIVTLIGRQVELGLVGRIRREVVALRPAWDQPDGGVVVTGTRRVAMVARVGRLYHEHAAVVGLVGTAHHDDEVEDLVRAEAIATQRDGVGIVMVERERLLVGGTVSHAVYAQRLHGRSGGAVEHPVEEDGSQTHVGRVAERSLLRIRAAVRYAAFRLHARDAVRLPDILSDDVVAHSRDGKGHLGCVEEAVTGVIRQRGVSDLLELLERFLQITWLVRVVGDGEGVQEEHVAEDEVRSRCGERRRRRVLAPSRHYGKLQIEARTRAAPVIR